VRKFKGYLVLKQVLNFTGYNFALSG